MIEVETRPLTAEESAEQWHAILHEGEDGVRPLTPEEHAMVTSMSQAISLTDYGRAVLEANEALADEKAAVFGQRTPGVEMKPLPDMDQMDALRFAVEAQTAWLERLERRLTALEAAREP